MLATSTLSRGWSAIRLTLAGAAVACCSLACDDAPSAPAVETPDAGACERGEEACFCIIGGGCRDGLLCIAGRCLTSEAEAPGDEPPLRRPRPPRLTPPEPAPDSGVGDAGSGSEGDGGVSAGADASAAEDGGVSG